MYVTINLDVHYMYKGYVHYIMCKVFFERRCINECFWVSFSPERILCLCLGGIIVFFP